MQICARLGWGLKVTVPDRRVWLPTPACVIVAVRLSKAPQVYIHWIHCIEHFFTVQVFWATCACPEKESLPWNFSEYWIYFVHSVPWICIKYTVFINQIFEQLARALKNRVCSSSKPRKRTHEASIHNMAHEDNLLSVIWSYETCSRFWSILVC